jgi:hypothetical protein
MFSETNCLKLIACWFLFSNPIIADGFLWFLVSRYQFKSGRNLRVDLDGPSGFDFDIYPPGFSLCQEALVTGAPKLVFPQGTNTAHIRNPGECFDFFAKVSGGQILDLVSPDNPGTA